MSSELMPCPHCGHPQGRDRIYKCEEAQIPCENECGAFLHLVVPFIAMAAPPYGWRWEVTGLRTVFVNGNSVSIPLGNGKFRSWNLSEWRAQPKVVLEIVRDLNTYYTKGAQELRK